MGVSDRWVRKLLVRMKTDGDGVVVHGLRGRSSNRQIDANGVRELLVAAGEQEAFGSFRAFCRRNRQETEIFLLLASCIQES
jgi:hypothetical protein